MLYQICTKQNGEIKDGIVITTTNVAEKIKSRLVENNYTAKIKNRLKKIQK
jgi:hypothetical protein